MSLCGGPTIVRRPERGFTLLEVLVAAVIAALALGVLLQGALASLHSVRVSGHYQEAVSRARSHLAALDASGVLTLGEHQGNDGRGFHWRLQVTPAASAPIAMGDATAQSRGPRVVLYAVTVVVSWDSDGGTRSVRLDSERVGAAPPAPP